MTYRAGSLALLKAGLRGSVIALGMLLTAVSPLPAKDLVPVKPKEISRTTEAKKSAAELPQGSRLRKEPSGSREHSRLGRGRELDIGVRLRSDAYKEALAATKRSKASPDGIWDADYLNGESEPARKLKTTIERYEKGEIGASVRDFDVNNKTAETIDKEAISKGFTRTEEPLATFRDDGTSVYYRKDNTVAVSSTEVGLARQIFYANRDGGLIRVKPDGDYNPNVKRSQPQVSRSVRFDAEQGTGWPNEAFKLGPEGQPLPKSPSFKGPEISAKLKSKIPEKYTESAEDAIADETHVDLRQK